MGIRTVGACFSDAVVIAVPSLMNAIQTSLAPELIPSKIISGP
jgi:hypothetical protein